MKAQTRVSLAPFLTFYKQQSSQTMAASSLTAAALGSKVAFANKVRSRTRARALLFRLPRVLSFIVVVLHARARCKRKGERDNFLSVKFYHRSPFAREEHALEEKGLQNAFFYYEEDASRDVNDDLFVRE